MLTVTHNIASVDTAVQVSIITTIGLVIVALIGVLTAKITSGARKEAQTNAIAAADSAKIVLDFVAALEAKDALIASLEGRIKYLEDHNERCEQRIEDLEARIDEHAEQQRASAVIEREYYRELEELRAKLSKNPSKGRLGS